MKEATTAARRDEFQNRLATWFAAARRELPWRENRHPYRVWVSEVMLQQTRAAAVTPYFLRFMERFPDLHNLAEADLDEALKLWEGLGYYARARNLHRAAKVVVEQHRGMIPSDYPRFRKLPGVGEYIAAAVLSIAFDQPYAVADGNVKRLLARLFREETPVNHSRADKIYRPLADQLLNRAHPGMHNQAMMELGSLVCRPRQPDCLHCPVRAFCRAHSAGVTDEFPRRLEKKQVPIHKMLCAVIVDQGQYLVVRRPETGMLGGLWEFPTLLQPNGRMSRPAKERAIAQRTGLTIQLDKKLGMVEHGYTHFRLQMEVLLCRRRGGPAQLEGGERTRWIQPDDFSRYAFHGAMQKVFLLLKPFLYE